MKGEEKKYYSSEKFIRKISYFIQSKRERKKEFLTSNHSAQLLINIARRSSKSNSGGNGAIIGEIGHYDRVSEQFRRPRNVKSA